MWIALCDCRMVGKKMKSPQEAPCSPFLARPLRDLNAVCSGMAPARENPAALPRPTSADDRAAIKMTDQPAKPNQRWQRHWRETRLPCR
jgi:hypothetical protein